MTAKQKAVVCLDVGGTEIKAAAVELDGVLLSPIHYFPQIPAGERKSC